MKKIVLFVMTAAVMLLSGSCGGGGNQQQAEAQEDSTKTEYTIPMDQTIYGICTDGTAMNTLEMITDSGDTLRLNLEKASEAGRCSVVFRWQTV